MKSYVLTHDGLFRNLIVTTHRDKADAENWLASSKKVGGEVISDEADLKNKAKGAALVLLYNHLAAIDHSQRYEGHDTAPAFEPIKKFETSMVGARRCFALIEALFQNKAPEAAAPTSASNEDAATQETPNNEDDMASKKKTKTTKAKKAKAVKAPRAAKVKKAKTPREPKAKKVRQYKAAVASKGGTKAKETALEMVSRKNGATVAEISEKLELSVGSAKNLIWYLRRDGHNIVVNKDSERKPYVIL